MKKTILLFSLSCILFVTSCNDIKPEETLLLSSIETIAQDALFLEIKQDLQSAIENSLDGYFMVIENVEPYNQLSELELIELIQSQSEINQLSNKLNRNFDLLIKKYPLLSEDGQFKKLSQLLVDDLNTRLAEVSNSLRQIGCLSCVKTFHSDYNEYLHLDCLDTTPNPGIQIGCNITNILRSISSFIQELSLTIANIFDQNECGCRDYIHTRCQLFFITNGYNCDQSLPCFGNVPSPDENCN